MARYQVKFYVNEEEKKRLDTIAKRCAMPTANYVKSTALGVRIRQPKEVFIYVDSDEPKESIEIEKEVIKEVIKPVPMPLADEDRAVLNDLLKRYRATNQFIKLDTQFNKQLIATIQNILDLASEKH